MSSGPRPPTYAEKRSSGVAGLGDRGSAGSGGSGSASSRPRMADGHSHAHAHAHGSFRADSSRPSDQKTSSSRYATDSTQHKRSTSGHPNPRSTSSSFEERRTEKAQVTTRETFISRTRSPPRRTAAPEKTRNPDVPKQRAPESRPREARQETPVPGMANLSLPCPMPHCRIAP